MIRMTCILITRKYKLNLDNNRRKKRKNTTTNSITSSTESISDYYINYSTVRSN